MRAAFFAAALLLVACRHAPSPAEPEPEPEPEPETCALVVTTVYGDTTRFADYNGPPPANLAALTGWWWDPENCQETGR